MQNSATGRNNGSKTAMRRHSIVERAAMEALEQRALFSAIVGIEAIDAIGTEASKTTAKFRLTRDDTDGELEVALDISGDAGNGVDYTEIDETVTFADGAATADITITPVDDSTYEGTETVTIAIAESMDYEIDEDADSAEATITDNEKPTISLTVDDSSADEDDDEETGTFVISRNGPTDGALAVKVTVTGTATNGTDYNSISTTVTIPDGEESANVDVVTKQDGNLEGKETVILTLAAGTTYNIHSTDKTGTVNITDDEKSTVKITASDAVATEGNAKDPGKFTITRTGATTAIAEALTVHFTVSGTATDGTDYDTIETSAVIPAGKTSVDVLIKTKQDTSIELGETAKVTLASNSAYTIDADNDDATVAIKDDDKPTVSISASDSSANEVGPSNTGKFTITRTGATTEALAVPIVITGTGKAGVDFKTISTTVTIPVGKSSKTVEVRPIDDADLEGPETVIATLGTSAASIASSENKTGTVTIGEDELPDVSITATDPTASEPTSDKGTFTVTRTGPTTSALTVNYTISGTADLGDDVEDIEDSVVIPAGKSSATITVAPKNDTDLEGSETVIVTLDSASTYDIDDDAEDATVTVKDDEKSTVTIDATDAAAAEASMGTGTFTLTRTGSGAAIAEALQIKYTISGTGTKGTDYNSLDGTVSFSAGSATKTITITPVDDSTLEVDETVILTLATGTAYTVGTDKTDTVTIAENDKPTVTLTGTDLSAGEPSDKGTITFTRNGPTTAALEVHYSIDDDSTADEEDDYDALSGTATIPAGKTSIAVTITPADDTDLEGKETIIVNTDSNSAYVVDGDNDTVTVNIADNEKPTVSVTSADAAGTEGDDDNETATITFTRTGPTTEALNVLYTVSGFGTAGTDTTENLTGTATIAAGSLTKTIALHITDDSAVEGSETLVVTLKAATAYTIHSTDKAATVAITDNDKPTVSIAATDASGKENSKDGLLLTITRTGATREALDVSLVTSGIAGQADFTTTLPTSATIPAGKSFVTVAIATTNDTTYEGTESLNALLVDGDDYIIDEDHGVAEMSITDDELPTISIDATDATASETGPATATFTISRDEDDPTTDAVTVSYTISGSAKNGKDYNKITKTVTIDAGDESATITVTPKADSKVEGPETVVLTLAKGSYNIASGASTDSATISDAQKPTLTVEAQDSPIDEDGNDKARFRIWRTGQSTGQSLLVEFELDGTAEIDTNYTLANEDGDELTDSVTIPAGEAFVDVYVTPVDNDDADGDLTVKLTLSSASAYTVDTDNDDATITITDDE